MKFRRLSLLLLILLAFGLRVYHLDVQSLWYDEGVTAQVARLGVVDLARWTANDIQPPLYYLLVGGWLRLLDAGVIELAFAMRWLSAAFGLLHVPLLWALGRRLWDETAGWLAALAAATSPLLVYYSQEARMYTLLLTWVVLAALLAVKQGGRRDAVPPRSADYVIYALVGLAALYTHYFAAFALLALALYGLIAWMRAGRPRAAGRAWLAAHVLLVIGYLPWLPAMFQRFRVDTSYWSGALKLGEALLDVAMNFTTGATEVMRETDARALLIMLAVATLAWAPQAWGRRSLRGAQPRLLLLLWGLLPIGLILALSYRTPKFNPRYLMISWPVWALIIGGGLSSLWQPEGSTARGSRSQPGGATLCGGESASSAADGAFPWIALSVSRLLAVSTLMLLLLVHTIGLYNWFFDTTFAKSAWRDAIAQMYFNRQPNEVSLLVSGHAYPVFDTYLPPSTGLARLRLPEIEILDVNQVLGWEEVAAAFNQNLASQDGVWLFLWQDEVVDPAHVATILLDRYADLQPTPSFPYLGLRHYRLRPGVRFPDQPPITGPGADFGARLRLVGWERQAEGLWLYWQGLASPLPDLLAAVTLFDANGQILAQQEGRPAGYDFPTTRWQAGESYPVLLPLPAATAAVQIHVRDAVSNAILGDLLIQP